jgi:excisionase family DNA binding protein
MERITAQANVARGQTSPRGIFMVVEFLLGPAFVRRGGAAMIANIEIPHRHAAQVTPMAETTPPDVPEILTGAELAEYLRLSTSTVYRLLKQKRIPAFKVASEWRCNRQEIDRWRPQQGKRQ